MHTAPSSTARDGKKSMTEQPKIVELLVTAGSGPLRVANVKVDLGDGTHVTEQGVSPKGPYTAIVNAIKAAVPHTGKLIKFKATAADETEGGEIDLAESDGQVVVVARINGHRHRTVTRDPDSLLAFARGYLGCVNQSRYRARHGMR